jgi:hypothetical protein
MLKFLHEIPQPSASRQSRFLHEGFCLDDGQSDLGLSLHILYEHRGKGWNVHNWVDVGPQKKSQDRRPEESLDDL